MPEIWASLGFAPPAVVDSVAYRGSIVAVHQLRANLVVRSYFFGGLESSSIVGVAADAFTPSSGRQIVIHASCEKRAL